ncbi:hypothetical protein ETH_00010135, partial [Eimeria tenella]
FLKNHRETIAEPLDEETKGSRCLYTLELLVAISEIPHDQTFQICLDFWFSFAETLLQEVQQEAKANPKP